MALNSAHQGYEYQDWLTAYFVLSEMLSGNDATFIIDKKISATDAFDDLTIERKGAILKKQIKYSDAHTFQKSDISANSGYQLAIDELFQSWSNSRNDEVRLCLAWNEPMDELSKILREENGNRTFPNYSTKLFKIDIDSLWPKDKEPLSSWQRLKKASKTINRDNFADFCDHLLIETDFPKFSLNIDQPGDLERIIFEQAEKIGVGIFPNQHISTKSFIAQLLLKIKESRSKGYSISSQSIFILFNIKTDFGAIEQTFPIDVEKNVLTKNTIRQLLSKFQQYRRLMILGEPGSGKSWLVNNLIAVAKRKSIHTIRHFCYTELKDEQQKERIKRDTLYGNLIADILKEFPELIDKKQRKYASTLSELNILLENISEPTILIIDGLDHIDRVYDFHQYTDISIDDIQIIEELDKIECSDKVWILLASQPTSTLQTVTKFQSFELPKWTKNEVGLLLYNYHIDDSILNGRYLSDILLEKGEGNPLYLTYLIKELERMQDISESCIKGLPPYSFNLQKYYDYLLTKLNTKEALPRILSGVNFYLTLEELKEITGDGDYTDEALSTLYPILKNNASQNGYIIYHESFRRYILDVLHVRKVSIEQNIFRPIVEWFKTKDFFSYTKAFRYGLKFYYNCRQFNEVVPFISKDFVVNGVIWGQPWELIENNVKILANTAISLRDFKHIVVANELFKTVGSTLDSYEESFYPYLECLGLIKGFEYVANFLSFERKATLDYKQGLDACYLCSQYSTPAPWNLYFDYFQKGKKIQLKDFKYYVRFFLISENTERIIDIAQKVQGKKMEAFRVIFKQEIKIVPNTAYTDSLLKANPAISRICKEKVSSKIRDIDEIIDKLKKVKGYTENDIEILSDFITQCNLQVSDNDKCKKIINQLSGKNWFYNWLIYCVKIARINNNFNYTFDDVKEAFSYLVYDLEPFKGEPRTCDLYNVQGLIYKTLKDGLVYIKTIEEWVFAIDTIVKVSEGVTTSIQGSVGGPIATDKLFELFEEISNPINNSYLLEKAIKLYEEKKEYHFFTYLSNYCFTISKLNQKSNKLEDSEYYFQLGARYMVSYTWRRDMTLTDGIDCVASVAKIDISLAKEQLKILEELTNSVINHTDGKDTKWLPIYWFEKYLKIDSQEAALWLMNQLYRTRYHWVLERNLKDLIEETKGALNPIVEQFILNSFIVDNSESYLDTALQLNEKIAKEDKGLALFFAKKIRVRLQTKNNSAYSKDLDTRLSSHLSSFNINYFPIEKTTSQRPNSISESTSSKRNKEFSEMPFSEIGEYIRNGNLSDTDIHSLVYYFDNLCLDKNSKQLINKCVIGKWRSRLDGIDLSQLDILLYNKDLRIYYDVLVFVWSVDGNGGCFSQTDRFKNAYLLDSKKAVEYLFELLPIIFKGINKDFSSNLLNSLVEAGYDSDQITVSFINLIEALQYKIPIVDKTDWVDSLSNDMSMNIEEILITIMLIRSKAYTSERLVNTLTGFSMLLYKEPEKLIKPLKWFFEKHEYFLDSVLLCILDILNEYHDTNPAYICNFQSELEKLYPQKYYLIDCLLERFLKKQPYTNLLIEPKLEYYHIEKNNTKHLISLNGRLTKLQNAGFNASFIVGKFKATNQSKYGSKMDLYGNRSYERMVKHIYPSNYILELVNKELYNEFRNLQREVGDDYYEYFNVCTKALIAQNLSFSMRPADLVLPSEGKKQLNQIPLASINGWIRLGHNERELKRGKGYSELEEYRSTGTFSMGHTQINRLALDGLYNMDSIYCTPHDGVLLQYNEYDPLENYHILWLNPIMMDELEIKTSFFLDGLVAKDSNNEIVLKCNQWHTHYIGNGDISGLQDEIPLISGVELSIREDYFWKMQAILGISNAEYTIAFLDID